MTRSLNTENKAGMSNSGNTGTLENLTQFVASKREMFLMSYSLTVKRDEMKKLSILAYDREEALRKAEKILEEDAARFDAFLKENNLKTMEATKRYSISLFSPTLTIVKGRRRDKSKAG
jgi:Domain of unknown function (DUF4200)